MINFSMKKFEICLNTKIFKTQLRKYRLIEDSVKIELSITLCEQ